MQPWASRMRTFVVVVLGCLLVAALLALGVWQLERRIWKHDLIARVDRRVHADPVAPPGPALWAALSADKNEYTRVSVKGRFLNDRETLVQAVTVLGGGDWVMTPLETDQGFTVLVNRGFVPPDRRDPDSRGQGPDDAHHVVQRPPATSPPDAPGKSEGETLVTGLLRMTEPKGGFLHANEPAAGRWYSRDVDAIAKARGLSNPAPYFIDADDRPTSGGWPRGGLTIVAFTDNHLVYAMTWFALALLPAWGVVAVLRERFEGGRAAKQPGAPGIAVSKC